MKYRHFLRIDEVTLPKQAFEEVCNIAPEGRKSYGFDLVVDSVSPDGGDLVRRITSICALNGLKRRRVVSNESYGHSADRWFGDERLRFEYLVVHRQGNIDPGSNPERDENGRLLLSVKPKWKFGSILPNRIILSEELRTLLEPEQFVGLEFGEVVFEGESGRTPLPFWEIKSSIVLPKIANVHQFIHPGRTDAEAFQGDYSKIIMISDPPFTKGEIHYRRVDLSALGAFDVARTFENYMEPHPALVISQRFYRCALNNGVKLGADPVRIDESTTT